jgi:O-antigen/teichoic acid export membrane protein
VLRRRIAGILGRLGWGVSDQALSSLTNFALGILIARRLGPNAVGAYGLAFSTYLLALNVSLGLAADPFEVRYSGTDLSRWRAGLAGAAGMALTVGVISGLGCLLAGLLLPGILRGAFIALGLTMPGLLLQDSYRLSFFAAARGGRAVLNDLIWAAAQFLGFALLFALHRLTVTTLVLTWGGAATVAAIAGGLQAGVAPRPSQVVAWLREHHDLAPRYLGENLAVGGTNSLWTYGIGIIAGVNAVGALQAARLLIAPLNVVFQGVGSMAVPEAIRVRRVSPRRLLPAAMVVAGGLSAVTLAWGAVMFALPPSAGGKLLGQSWPIARSLLVPMILITVDLALTVGALVGLRALAAAQRSLTARLLGSSLILGGAFVGAALGGAMGAAWGHVVGSTIAVLWWWRHLLRAVQEDQAAPPGPAGGQPSQPVGRTE